MDLHKFKNMKEEIKLEISQSLHRYYLNKALILNDEHLFKYHVYVLQRQKEEGKVINKSERKKLLEFI